MTEQDILFKRIIKAYEEDNLTLFVGAGVSKTVKDNKAKLWKDLVKEMQEILGEQENDPLILAQILYKCFPEKYESLIKSSIDNRNISEVHKCIAELQPKIIITTNWDCLLENALETSFYDVVASDGDLLESRRERKLIKMHGDLLHNNIVFKEDDYLNYSDNFPLIENFVKTILYTSNVLFLGYSYNDINLKNIMNWLQQKSGNRDIPFYVMTEFKENRIKQIYYNKWNILTYICNDQKMCEANIFADDELHRSYRIYNLLKSIKEYKNKFDEYTILGKIQLYNSLYFVPLEIMENVLNSPKLMMNEKKLHLSYFRNKESQERIIFDKIRNCVLNEPDDENIRRIINFINNSSIEGICFMDYEQNPSKMQEIINFQASHKTDINRCLTFCKPTIDEENIENDYKRKIKGLIDREDYLNLIIYIFKISQYHKVGINTSDTPDEDIVFPGMVYDIIPKYIVNKYKILIDILSFEYIKKYTLELINESEKLLSEIFSKKKYITIVTNKEGISYLRNRELEDFIYFVSKNDLFVEQNIEVKDYVYQSSRYEILCQIKEKFEDKGHSSNQTGNLFNMHIARREIFNIRNDLIVSVNLTRLHLFAILQYLESYMVERLFDNKSYRIDILILKVDNEDKVWLIEDVLENIINNCKRDYSNDCFLIKLSWFIRLGILLKIFSLMENDLNSNDIIKINKQLMTAKQIIKDPRIIGSFQLFIKRYYDKGNFGEIIEYMNMRG